MADFSGVIYNVTGSIYSAFTRNTQPAVITRPTPVSAGVQAPHPGMIPQAVYLTTGSGGGGTVTTYYRGVSGSVFTYSTNTPPVNSINIVILGTRTS